MSGRRGQPVSELLVDHGHEQVVFVADRDAGLRAVIAVHSTALGPALGGVRFWQYASDRDALLDALRLSEAMTWKAAVSGLHQGGAKAVVRWDDADRPRPPELLRALGRAIDALGGRYLAAEDVGATTADMDGIARETPWVTGVDEAAGGSGDPSPATALGLVHAMRAVFAELDGDRDLAGRHVVVQGSGHVGAQLARLLVGVGARVTVSDLRPERATALADAPAFETVAHERVLELPCDVLAPCALGAVLDDRSIPRLQCRAIVGAANNQLARDGDADLLAARGILYAPDFVVNAGGIINIAEEFTGYDRERALANVARIEETLAGVFTCAREWGVPPARAADRIARHRVAEEGGGRRWMPGDPAAWTAGAPLTGLRPGR
jgi:leucine dehydrogenase